MSLRTFVTACIVIAAAASVATAQNMIENGNFDTDVNGWLNETVVILAWSDLDAADSSSSGSALVSNTHPNAGNGAGIRRCASVPVTAGEGFVYGGKILFPSGQARTGNAQVGLRFYEGPDCSGSQISGQPRLSTAIFDTWVLLDSDEHIAPAGAQSVMFMAFPSKVEAGGVLDAYFDDLYVEPGQIFEAGFESGDTDDWDLVVP